MEDSYGRFLGLLIFSRTRIGTKAPSRGHSQTKICFTTNFAIFMINLASQASNEEAEAKSREINLRTGPRGVATEVKPAEKTE